MHSVLLIATATLISASPSSRVVSAPFEVLSHCDDLKAARCLSAVAQLEAMGPKAIHYITPRIGTMAPLGQMLALSVYGTHPSFDATQGLATLALKPKLAPSIRSVAIQLLADRFKGKRTKRLVSATLIKASKDKQDTIRSAAIRALGNRAKSGDRHIIQVLRRAANDPAPVVRAEALLGLGMSAQADAASLLTAALKDAVLRVRIAAAGGLSFIKSDDAIEPLIHCLRSDEGQLRRVASEALAFQTGLQFGDDYLLWREWLLNR